MTTPAGWPAPAPATGRRPASASPHPAAANPAAATTATAASCHTDWVTAAPPRCPTRAPYVAQPSAASVAYGPNRRTG